MAFDRACDECGTTYEAKTHRSKFCGAVCRVRANRRPDKVGQHAADAAEAKPAKRAARKAPAKKAAKSTAEKPAAPEPPKYDTVADQVKADLERFHAFETISGKAAWRIAQQIDRGRDTGSAVATLTKELTRLVGEAKVESAPLRRDAVDDLQDRAGAKLGMHLVAG